MAEEVTARRHEEAGRESGDQRRIFGVDVFPERRMPPTAAIDYVREENADVVEAGRIKHAGDEAKRRDVRGKLRHAGGTRHGGVFAHCREIHAEIRARAVAAEEELGSVPAKVRGERGGTLNARSQSAEHREDIHIRHERVFKTEYDKSAAAHVRTEETVCLLLPEQEPAAVDVHEHRQGFLCLARAEYVHPVTGPAIAHVVRVRREEHVLRERICGVVPREKALELLLLLRRLGADHFFQHICRRLSWDFP